MAKALSIVQHPVSDYAAWRTVYEQVQPLRDKHGVSAADPGLKDAMAKAGVTAPPRIEIVVEA